MFISCLELVEYIFICLNNFEFFSLNYSAMLCFFMDKTSDVCSYMEMFPVMRVISVNLNC